MSVGVVEAAFNITDCYITSRKQCDRPDSPSSETNRQFDRSHSVKSD